MFCLSFASEWLRIKGQKGQVFKAWSTSRKSQSQIQHLGRAFEHNLAPRDGNLNKLILNSSNAWGRGDVEASNCLTHKCGIIGNTLVCLHLSNIKIMQIIFPFLQFMKAKLSSPISVEKTKCSALEKRFFS